MPSKPRPKMFVAAKPFRHAGRVYRKGDQVTVRRTIDLLSKRGDSWITRKPAPAEPAAEVSAEQSTETPKEG